MKIYEKGDHHRKGDHHNLKDNHLNIEMDHHAQH